MMIFKKILAQPTSPQAEFKEGAEKEARTKQQTRGLTGMQASCRALPVAAFPPVLAGIRADKQHSQAFPCKAQWRGKECVVTKTTLVDRCGGSTRSPSGYVFPV